LSNAGGARFLTRTTKRALPLWLWREISPISVDLHRQRLERRLPT
jgi:hypothetical protein